MIKLMYLLLILIGLSACKKDPCKDQVCINGGACLDGTCLCETNYSGEHCEIYTPPPAPVKEKYYVSYTLTCRDCDVTYINEYGATETWKHMTSNWAENFVAYSGQFLYISAYNNDTSGGVTVRIVLNNVTHKQAISNGGHTTTTVGSTAP